MMQGFQQAGQQPQYQMDPGDEKLFVQFYVGARKNDEKSEEAGHPVFDSVPFVKILVPGDKNTLIDTAVTDAHKRRFARLWDQFQNNQKQELSGMPIREWPAVTRGQAEELIYLNIMTVEQLAQLADVYGSKIMGFNDLKRKAIDYVEKAKDAAYTEKLSAELAKRDLDIAALRDQVKQLSDLISARELQKAKGKDDDSAGNRSNRSG